jgi:hypothetical protein
MALEVELVYDPDCPSVDEARAALAAAFAELGVPARWRELRRGDPDFPPRRSGLGSPTILVNDRDVSGAVVGSDALAEGPCCRIYGTARVPPRGAIVAAIRAAVS